MLPEHFDDHNILKTGFGRAEYDILRITSKRKNMKIAKIIRSLHMSHSIS